MTRRVAAALVVLGLLGLGVWLWPTDEAAGGSSEAEASDGLSREGRAALERAADAGRRTFEGLVVDATGAPVPGATVSLFLEAATPDSLHCATCGEALLDCGNQETVRALTLALARGTLFPAPLAVTSTGADGRYRVEAVAELPLHVVARAGALAGASSDGSGEVTVQAPVEQTLLLEDAQQRPIAGAQVWALLPGLLEARRLTSGADGLVRVESRADEHTRVLLDDPRYVPQLSMTGDEPMVVSTPHTLLVHTRLAGQPVDAEVRFPFHGEPKPLRAVHGELRLEGLPARSYLVGAAAGAFTAPERDVSLEAEVTELTLELRAGGRLLLSVVDEDGQPVEGASGSLDGADSSLTGGPTEGGALLVLGPAAEGEYSLTVTGKDLRELHETVDLRPGDQARELVLRRASVLSGRVLDAKGPVAEVEVSLSAPGVPTRSVVTDEHGAFTLSSVPLADAVVTAQSDAVGHVELHTKVPATVELRLEPRASVRVELRDARGRALVDPRALLLSEPDSETLSVPLGSHDQPDERAAPPSLHRGRRGETQGLRGDAAPVAPATHDGWSEGVLRGLKPGPWELTVSADGVVEVVRKLTLVDGQTTLVQVTLEPGASVEGQVLDAAGAPLPGAVVFATANTSATTDAAGRFFLEGLNPGKVAISASSETAEFDPVEVEVPARGVVLQAPKRLLASGRVVDPAGRPVSPFEANGQTVTDPGGAFTVPLHKGRRLMISARKYELLSLQDAGEALGTLVLQPSPLAEGDVVDADGQPVAGARVRARSTLSDAVTGADGRFVLQLSEVSPSSEVSVIATRGALLGRAPLVLGGGRTRVVLGRGTLVSGRVLSGSTPAPGVDVAIESADGVDGSRSVTSGAGGTFEVMLWAGSWTFTAAGLRVSRTVEVAGDRTAVELGGQLGRCALEITASEPLDMVTLEPMGAEVEHGGRRPGTIVIEAQHSPHLLASDLPCETFIVSASHGVTEGQIQLRLEAHTTWNGQSPEP